MQDGRDQILLCGINRTEPRELRRCEKGYLAQEGMVMSKEAGNMGHQLDRSYLSAIEREECVQLTFVNKLSEVH
jgi:uncharacterized lipoprotein NlpE involved in copper resistance